MTHTLTGLSHEAATAEACEGLAFAKVEVAVLPLTLTGVRMAGEG